MADEAEGKPVETDQNRIFLLEEIDRYHLYVGRFVTRFAEIEALVRLQCAAVSATPLDMAGLLFGNLTVNAGVDMLRGLRRARGLAADPDLDRALSQLTLIATVRNSILHRGVDFHEAGFTTKQGLPNSRGRTQLVSPDVLMAMYLDLNPISAALIVSSPVEGPDFPRWSKGFRGAARTPWQYTPAP